MAISYGTYTITEVQEGSQIWTSSAAPTTPNYTFDVSHLTGDSDVPVREGDIILNSYYRYTVLSISSDGTTVLTGNRTSIRGATGAASVTYALIVSNLAIVKDKDGNLSPSTITVTAKSQTGSNAMANYTGRIKIETTTNNSTWTSRINEDAATKTYTIPSDTVAIRCSLYLKGGTTTLLDQQTVPVVSDGIDGTNGTNGKNGVDGKDAYTVILTNENHTFAGNTTSAIASEIECNVIAYKGTTQIAATIGTITGQPTGMTTEILNNGKTNASFKVNVTTSMVTKNGVLNIPITVDGKAFTKKFTYALALKGSAGTSENLLMDVYASSLTKVDAPWDRYLSEASNTTITGQFIAETNLPDPNATHFYRITDSSASTKGRGLCFYSSGTPPFIDGHTYRIGCWVRKHAGSPKVFITLGSIGSLTHTQRIVDNTEWEWIEVVRTFGDTDASKTTQSDTYKRLYFYFYNNNVAGSSLDMCGFRMEEVQVNSGTARNFLLGTEKLTNWGATNGATISDGIATFPIATSDSWREIYPAKNFKYNLIRNQYAIFSIKVKGNVKEVNGELVGEKCCINLGIGVDTTETAYIRKKFLNQYVYFTGTGEWQTVCSAIPIFDYMFASGTGTVDFNDCWVTVRIGAVNNYWNGFQAKEPQLCLGTTATSWSRAPEDVDETINNIEIGGRNLIRNTAIMPTTKINGYNFRASGGTVSHVDISSSPINGITGAIRITNKGSSTARIGMAQDSLKNCFIVGEKYTMSCWVRASTALEIIFQMIWASDERTTKSSSAILGYNFNVGTDWTYLKWEGATLLGTQVSQYSAGYVYGLNVPVNGWIEVCGLKVEKGNKATAWTPAPEDIENEVSNLRTDLQAQIDEKIQTYYQATAPSWSSATDRAKHDGDLWYCTETDVYADYKKDRTYRYDSASNKWIEYSATSELFDKLDGKTTVYYGTTSGTYENVETGDYLVDSTDGSSYRWNGTQWVKVTDYKTAIDNIEVGGRNLLKKSNNLKSTDTTKGITFTYLEDGWFAVKGTVTGTSAGILCFYGNSQHTSNISGSGEYTLSIETDGTIFLPSNKTWIQLAYHSDNATDNTLAGDFKILSGSTKVTFTIPENHHISRVCLFIRANATDGVVDGNIRLKLEKGNKATDWTPAPEDIIVGKNLILLSKNLKSFTPENLTRSTVTYTDDSCTITNTYGDTRYGVYYDIDVESGLTYTLSFQASNVAGTNINYGVGNRTPDQTASWNTITGGYKDVTNGSNVCTFIIPDTVTKIRIYFGAGSLNGTMTISNLKLEVGNRATEWTSAPEDIQYAMKVANNYLSMDETGIMIADMSDSEQTPSTAMGRNVFIDNTSVNIRDGQTILASFDDDEVRIGKEGNIISHFTDRSMEIGLNNSLFIELGCRNKEDGRVHMRLVVGDYVSEIETEWGISEFDYAEYADRVDATNDITIVDEHHFTVKNRRNVILYINYWTSDPAPVFTFGTRVENSAKGFRSMTIGKNNIAAGQDSFAVGENNNIKTSEGNGVRGIALGGNNIVTARDSQSMGWYCEAKGSYSHAHGYHAVAASSYQTAVGKYNVVDTEGKNLFIIGNGASASDTSNALAIDWYGNIYLDMNITNSTTNQNLLTAIQNAGWKSSVIE